MKPSQVEHFKVSNFMGRLLASTGNIGIARKGLARTNTLAFQNTASDEEKNFYNIKTSFIIARLFYFVTDAQTKLARLCVLTK
jgi:hypothetical protein